MHIRTGQAPEKLPREEFSRRFRERYLDPNFRPHEDAIAALEETAWQNYCASRKAPFTRPAGEGYADPSYELSVDWLAARARIEQAVTRQRDPEGPARVLVICAAARNDGTCPSEMSKTFRLAGLAREVLEAEGCEIDLLDLSLLSSEYGRQIHPCKACVSTAMPMCHWPCSCYPNHSLGQTGDWMNEIYERWVLAHAVIILTPVYWYQAPSGLKSMIDRLVCADGGNPDPTSTAGKDPKKAKKLELAGWDYPKHLAGRVFGVVVHGDVAGIESLRRGLCDWLESMRLIPAGASSQLDRYVGYYEPYATSHEALDRDDHVQEEVKIVARSVANAVHANRRGELFVPDRDLRSPRPK